MLNNLYFKAKQKLHQFLVKEEGDVNVVSIVVLCGVAVILAVIFKDAISGLITNLIGTITNNATNAVTGP